MVTENFNTCGDFKMLNKHSGFLKDQIPKLKSLSNKPLMLFAHMRDERVRLNSELDRILE